MKKKVVALFGAVLLVASMTMTALAAPSPEAATVITGIEKVTDADGKELPSGARIVVKTLGSGYAEPVAFIKKTENVKSVLGDAYVDGMQVVDIKDVVVEGDAGAIKWPTTVTLKAKSIRTGQKIALLQYDAASNSWKVVEATAGDGVVVAKLSTAAPIALVVKDVQSPSTGETSMMMWAIAAVVIGAVGVVASKKRA